MLDLADLDSSERGLKAYSALVKAYTCGFDLVKFLEQYGYDTLLQFFHGVSYRQGDKTYQLGINFSVLKPDQLEEVFTEVGKRRSNDDELKLAARGLNSYRNLDDSKEWQAVFMMIYALAKEAPGLLSDVHSALQIDISLIISLYKKFLLHHHQSADEFYADLQHYFEGSDLLEHL